MTTLTPKIDSHAHKDFIEAAIADGWTVEAGSWGYREECERSVVLTKSYPNLGGTILLWLMHRNLGKQDWDAKAGRWATSYPADRWFVSTQAWLKREPRGDWALSVKLDQVLAEGLSESYWERLARTCDNCGKVVEHLNHVAFANKACDNCVAPMKAKFERPGWTN